MDPPARRALILVRNTVSHDARVLREADTLLRMGFSVLVVGVVSTSDRARDATVDGVQVTRLDPAGALKRRFVRGGRQAGSAAPANDLGSRNGTVATQPAANSRGVREFAYRLAVTASYYLMGIGLVWRTRPDVVHANDYNTMWIAIAAKLLRRSRIVYDAHELWPDRNGRPEWRPWLVFCERLFVRVADVTTTTSPGYAAEIADRYGVSTPIVVRNIPARGVAYASVRRADSPLVVYIGGLMPGRGLEQAIRALALTPELRLRLIGAGGNGYARTLLECARLAGTADRVEFQPAVAPGAVVDAVAGAQVGLMLIEPVCLSYKLTLPNKLFEYAAARVPILASDLPVIGPLVRSEGLGQVVRTDSIESIADGMRALTNRDVNAGVRERVDEFARRVNWEHERKVLERIYEMLAPQAIPE